MALLLACETKHQFQEAAYQEVGHYTSSKGVQTTPVFALRGISDSPAQLRRGQGVVQRHLSTRPLGPQPRRRPRCHSDRSGAERIISLWAFPPINIRARCSAAFSPFPAQHPQSFRGARSAPLAQYLPGVHEVRRGLLGRIPRRMRRANGLGASFQFSGRRAALHPAKNEGIVLKNRGQEMPESPPGRASSSSPRSRMAGWEKAELERLLKPAAAGDISPQGASGSVPSRADAAPCGA
jgi:hypothetical protein